MLRNAFGERSAQDETDTLVILSGAKRENRVTNDRQKFLSCNGIEYKDNRPKNGCLWIKAEAFPNARAVHVDGRRLMYSKASKALKGEAGWYIS